MNINTNLSNGNQLFAWQAADGTARFEVVDPAFQVVDAPGAASDQPTTWIGARPLADGGFTLAWEVAGGGLFSQDIGASGSALGPVQALSSFQPQAEWAQTTAAASAGATSQLRTSDGGLVTAGISADGVLTVTKTDAQGVIMTMPFVSPQATPGSVASLSPLTINGGYEVEWVGPHDVVVAAFSAEGQVMGTIQGNGDSRSAYTAPVVLGLPDGGFVETFLVDGAINVWEWRAAGVVRGFNSFSADLGVGHGVSMETLANGQYAVHWLDASDTAQTRIFTEVAASWNIGDPARPAAPTLSISGPGQITEPTSGAATAAFVVTRSGDLSAASQVDYALTTDGSASSADSSDFIGPTAGTIGFAQGQATAVVKIEVAADAAPEANEAFHLTLANPQNGVIGTGDATATIVDLSGGPNPTGFAISTHGAVVEGDTGPADLAFTITRGGDLSAGAEVDYFMGYGSTASPDDFASGRAPSGAAYFAPGVSQVTIHAAVAGDTQVEHDEVVVIDLSNARGDTIANGSATTVVLNDDPASSGGGRGLISITGPGSETAGTSGATDFAFHVTRTGDLSQGAAVDYYQTYGGSADSSDFAGPTAGTAYFQAGQADAVIHIAVAGDPNPEPDETFTLALSNARGGTIDQNAGEASATIVSGAGSSSSVSTSDPDYIAPSGVHTITLTGTSSQTVHGNNDGDTFWSNNNANTLIGGTGDDTFHLGRNGDVATGGGGNDVFAFAENPWSPAGRITDFNTGDTIDLTETLHRASYSSGDPVAEGYVKFQNDSSGNAQVWFNPDPSHSATFWLVTGLDGVDAGALHANAGLITM